MATGSTIQSIAAELPTAIETPPINLGVPLAEPRPQIAKLVHARIIPNRVTGRKPTHVMPVRADNSREA